MHAVLVLADVMLAGHGLVDLARRCVGLRRGAAEALGFGDGLAEAAQALVGQRRPRRRRRRLVLARALGGVGLDLADRLFEREAFARDVGFVERRLDAAQLIDQRGARALVEHAAVLAGVLFEPGDGAGDQRMIISHCASEFASPRTDSAPG